MYCLLFKVLIEGLNDVNQFQKPSQNQQIQHTVCGSTHVTVPVAVLVQIYIANTGFLLSESSLLLAKYVSYSSCDVPEDFAGEREKCYPSFFF